MWLLPRGGCLRGGRCLAGLLVLFLLLELFYLLDNGAAFLDFEVEMEILAFALLFLEQAFQSQVPIVGFTPS